MHPWHDHPVNERHRADHVPAIIEVPKGSRNKYELDKESGLLRLDDRTLEGKTVDVDEPFGGADQALVILRASVASDRARRDQLYSKARQV